MYMFTQFILYKTHEQNNQKGEINSPQKGVM